MNRQTGKISAARESDGLPVTGKGGSLAVKLFPGSGEMARLIRTKDWSKTALGPVEMWPRSLATAVSICLGSRHPIVLWWGPERWMFYNDGYRPMLGDSKHPQFLGGSGQECWAEIWDVIGPMMEQVIETGEATWSEDLPLLMRRHGYLEETYFTFSYSPIRDESGRPSGVFNACTESTARVLSERRMKVLREMAIDARTEDEAARRCAEVLGRNARDVPFALIYLRDRSNDSFRPIGYAGIPSELRASLEGVARGLADTHGWPVEEIVARGEPVLVDGLKERFVELPKEPWDEAPNQAMLLPVGGSGAEEVAGALVLAISPRRAFDRAYREFFELLARQVSTAVSMARAYEMARERAERLADVDRAKTAFFNNVSHELRTPLTLILGPVEAAVSSVPPTLYGPDLEVVHRSSMRLLRLVNDLLDFSRVEAGRLSANLQPTDLALLTAALAGAFQSTVESGGLKLIVDCPALSRPVWIDPSHWEKVVLNLVSNAFKFTFEGEISVRLREKEDTVELTVSDTGVGIPTEEQAKVFERFHRVEGTRGRSFEGTGIGLALVAEIAKQHGGFVRLESVVGRGTRFLVEVPIGGAATPGVGSTSVSVPAFDRGRVAAYVSEASRWNSSAAGSPGGGRERSHEDLVPIAAKDQGSPRILLAEDNADMREYIVRLLAGSWTIDAVADGQAALEAVQQDPPDLVLSDVMMPRLNGVGLLRALRKDPKTSTIPLILLSARAGEEAVISGLDMGADDYLVKPFSAPELLSRVRTHLELARARRAWTREIERMNKELEAFGYSVSHDLRAPLRTIDGFSQALLRTNGSRIDEQGRHYLERILAGTTRMSALIDGLLGLSRISRKPLRREQVDLSGIALEVAEELRRREPARAVIVDVAPGLTARGDRQLIRIAVDNLLGNAWKFTAKRAEGRIWVGSETTPEGVAFFVRDNGAGFDMSYANRLFTPFQRLHKESDFEGTGIGLATVQRIISGHGGRLAAIGEVEVGAKFIFTLEGTR